MRNPYKTINPQRMSKNSYSDDIAVRSSVGAWFGSWLTAGILIIAWNTLQNNRRNTQATQHMLVELEKINKTLNHIYQQ